jgi:hypothetical protein
MIRYFFAIFIAVTAFALNALVFSINLNGVTLTLSALGANLFIMSLACFWLGGYVRKYRQAGFLIYGHALVSLSAGMAFFTIGYKSLISNSCLFLTSNSSRQDLISRVARFAVENNLCTSLGSALILFGIFLAWPSLKLFFSYSRAKNV